MPQNRADETGFAQLNTRNIKGRKFPLRRRLTYSDLCSNGEKERKEKTMGFIDDVMKNINQGISDIQNKSQDMMQQMSINTRIKTLEDRKQQLLVNIGQLVYDKYEKGDEVSDDLLREKVKEIAGIERDIDLAKTEMAQVKTEPDAPRAQKAAYGAGYKPTPGFACPHCGAPANSSKFYCVACGGSLKDGSETSTNGESAEKN
jgi:hypothetical protein